MLARHSTAAMTKDLCRDAKARFRLMKSRASDLPYVDAVSAEDRNIRCAMPVEPELSPEPNCAAPDNAAHRGQDVSSEPLCERAPVRIDHADAPAVFWVSPSRLRGRTGRFRATAEVAPFVATP